MKLRRMVSALALVGMFASTAGAGELADAIARAADEQASTTLTPATTSSKGALMWSGAGVFAGGMATALFGFIRVNNGEFSQFGEATSRNKPLGAAGIAAAFAGGTMMFLANHRRLTHAPAVSVTAKNITVSTQVSW